MTERGELESIVRELEEAWNAMDGEAFAAPFARDADFREVSRRLAPGHNAWR